MIHISNTLHKLSQEKYTMEALMETLLITVVCLIATALLGVTIYHEQRSNKLRESMYDNDHYRGLL
jgi:hypothetical protein